MKFIKLLPIFFLFLGNFPSGNFVHAEVNNPDEFKVFSTNNKKLSIANVEYYLKTPINEFNSFLNEKMLKQEEIALKNVGR